LQILDGDKTLASQERIAEISRIEIRMAHDFTQAIPRQALPVLHLIGTNISDICQAFHEMRPSG
jgi:hypothetical protein